MRISRGATLGRTALQSLFEELLHGGHPVECRAFLKARKILIIDDEDDIREVAAAALEIVAGWQAIQASSGAQGIAVARHELPDAILLDMQMPGMSGPEVLAYLRAAPKLSAIPVVFLTARIQVTDRQKLIQGGAAAVFPKPFDPLKLADDLASVLRWNRA